MIIGGEIVDLEKIGQVYNEIKLDDDFKYYLEEKFCLMDFYYKYEFEYEFMFTGDLYGACVYAAYDLVNNCVLEYDEVKKVIKEINKSLSDDEIMMLIVSFIAKIFKYKVEQNKVMSQGEEWGHDSQKIEQYGSRGIASSRGYDSYMENHYDDDYTLLDRAINEYENIKKAMNKR